MDYLPKNPPSPTNTKQRAKRTKHTFTTQKRTSIRKPNAIGLIYRKHTNTIVADEATEKRLGRLGSGQLREYTFLH